MHPRPRSAAVPFLLALLVPGAVAVAQLPDDMVARIRAEGLENSQAMRFQDHLCNHVGQRLTGSDSFDHAAEWARDEFAAMGLEARLDPWGEWNLRWNRGQWSGRVVSPEPMELQVATPAWSAPTLGRVQGPLVRVPEDPQQLEALWPRLGEVYLWGPRPRARSELGEQLYRAAGERPPLGWVQSSGSTGRTDRRWENQIRVFGNSNVARGSWENIPTVPEIVVRQDQADRIEEMLDSGAEVVVSFDIRNRFRPGPVTLNNVVADLRGSEKPDEMVIVCGHLDSWHQATGATDNGTGSVTTLESARILSAAGAQPKRTIRFILWGGEEQGLLGSRAYVTRNRSDMDKVSAVLNHDTGTNWAHSLTVTEQMYPMFEEVMHPVMHLPVPEPGYDGPVFELRQQATIGGFGGSDHASFLAAGVPAWSWGLRGESEYGYGWHSQWDTYDIVIPEYQKHTATVIALTALGLANLPELLPRDGVQRRSRGRGITAFLRSRFGIEVDDELTVTEVIDGTPAARAGLAKGDVLQKLWDREIEDRIDIYRAWRANAEDVDAIDFVVQRGGASKSLRGLFAPAGDEAAEEGQKEESEKEGVVK